MKYLLLLLLPLQGWGATIQITVQTPTSIVTATGVTINNNLILTNAHVTDNATSVTYKNIPLTILTTNEQHDISILYGKTKTKPTTLINKSSGNAIAEGFLDDQLHKSSPGQFTTQNNNIIFSQPIYSGMSGGPLLVKNQAVGIIKASIHNKLSCEPVASLITPTFIINTLINNLPTFIKKAP